MRTEENSNEEGKEKKWSSGAGSIRVYFRGSSGEWRIGKRRRPGVNEQSCLVVQQGLSRIGPALDPRKRVIRFYHRYEFLNFLGTEKAR
ncbi:unnamed protein product [Amoebophrya sp. A25]|nr:unnamed protein product [Amoebophrya sp. A25]|eukprot:GSA25T00006190001.1